MKAEKILDAMELKLAELLGLYGRLYGVTGKKDHRLEAAVEELYVGFEVARESLK